MAALPPLEFTLEGQGEPDQILMHHTSAWWIAEFRGPVGRRMRAISGADTVLTGFNGHIPAAVVCQAIAMLNPSAKVAVAEPPHAPVAKQPSARNAGAVPGRRGFCALHFPPAAECFVQCNTNQPGGKLRSLLELVQMRERIDVRLLHHVLDLGFVLDDCARRAVNALVVPPH